MRPQVLMPVSPAGCEEERGAACGCAVRGSALAGRAVSAVHAGGGATDEPGQAALLTAAHPTPEDPRPAWSCIQPGQGCVAAPPGSVQPGLRLPSPSSVAPYKKPRPTESGPHFLPRSALCRDHPLTVAARGHDMMTNSQELVSGVCVLSGGHLGAQGLDIRPPRTQLQPCPSPAPRPPLVPVTHSMDTGFSGWLLQPQLFTLTHCLPVPASQPSD